MEDVANGTLNPVENLSETLSFAHIVFVGVRNCKVLEFASKADRVVLNDLLELETAIKNDITQTEQENKNFLQKKIVPDLIILDSIQPDLILSIRRNDFFVMTPIIIVTDSYTGITTIDDIASIPRLVLCNTCVINTLDFMKKIHNVITKKNNLLPARTALIVKYTILFINNSESKQVTRGGLSEKVGVTEDYLTRIFHQEMGLSLWDYLNCYRMDFAVKLLQQTDDTVYMVADRAGFPDAAYFNRVFHKKFGVSPGKFRRTGLPTNK